MSILGWCECVCGGGGGDWAVYILYYNSADRDDRGQCETCSVTN